VTAVESLDGDQPTPVPVDPPQQRQPLTAEVLASRTVNKRPLVAPWLRSWKEFRAVVVWLSKYGAHTTAFHAGHSPLYLARLLARSPRGGWRVGVLLANWVLDREQHSIRADAVKRSAVSEYLALSKLRKERVKQRAGTVAVLVVVLAVGYLVAAHYTPLWSRLVVAGVLVGALGVVGTNADRRIVDAATVSPFAPPPLREPSVTRALRALGVAGITAKDAELTYPAPITRDGPGWRADVDLPHGITAAMVMEKRAELASGLRRPLGCVWPGPGRDEHAGRLVLWVGDQDLAKARQPGWPLARTGRTTLFEPVPFGTDQRGRVVSVTLMFSSMIVGSVPRMGKTFSVRLLLLAAALDPLAELHLFEMKGSGDFSALEPVAHAYRAGDDQEDIEYIVADLRKLSEDLRRRMKVIRSLPKDLCPESKITPELAAKRSLGLHPVVVAMDECQRGFEHPTYGKELETLAEDLVRRGPAAGIIAIFATQRPDAKSLPTGISGNAVLRFCLKVIGHQPNDQVLGTGAHKAGVKATMFSRRDLGIGWLSGEDDDPQITRTFYVDNPGAEVIVTRARAARELAGTLSGHALGEDGPPDLTPAASLLEDMRVIFATAEVVKLPTERILELLEQLRPAIYGGWTPEQLAAALRADRVAPGQVWADGKNRKGYDLEHITEALQRRQIDA
jgi:S-DNA-T family DNA segregation ATPase FtsK/SpoIIIE